MSVQMFRSIAVVGVLILGVAATSEAQQQPGRTAAGCPLEPLQFQTCAKPKLGTFNPPRTPEGRPDMQGFWARTVASQEIEAHLAGYGRQAGPSFVLDTSDRKIPYQPWAMAFRKGMDERFISPMSGCYPTGVPRQVFAPGGERIVQTAGYLAFLLEYSHSYRIISTTPRPHLAKDVALWNGDSVGHWEGNTLVVDVANQNGRTWFDNAGNFYSDALHVVERMTLLDADTIHYEARIEDPKVYTRPWTMAFALLRNTAPGYELLEEACREGSRINSNDALKPYRGPVIPRN